MSVRRVAICAAQVPFEHGGAEELVAGLSSAIKTRGYQVDVIALPFRWEPLEDLCTHALMWRLLRLEESNGVPIDAVIATKYPSYLVRHPHKVTWLVHQLRQAYDLAGTRFGFSNESADQARIFQAVVSMDTVAFAESRRNYAISGNVAARLQRFNGVKAAPLYPPPRLEGRYRAGPFGDYIFTAGRLDPLKRFDLLIRAVPYLPSTLRVVIAGRGSERDSLIQLAESLGVADRVTFVGFVDDERLLELYSGALAVFYAPFDEDYGYVTIEAFQSAKPVVTTTDSGGVLEFVRDRETGRVVAPDPEEIAGAIRELDQDRPRAREYGAAGAASTNGITWDRVVEELLAP